MAWDQSVVQHLNTNFCPGEFKCLMPRRLPVMGGQVLHYSHGFDTRIPLQFLKQTSQSVALWRFQ